MNPITPPGSNRKFGGKWVIALLERGRMFRRWGQVLWSARRGSIVGLMAGILAVGAGAYAAANWNGLTGGGSHLGLPVSGRHHAKRPAENKPVQRQTGRPAPTAAQLLLPVAGQVQTGFGWAYTSHLGEWYYNPGITLSAPAGQPVHAAWAGTVTWVGQKPETGLSVEINDGNNFQTVYTHLGKADVSVGTWAAQGAPIGTVGGPNLYSRQPGAHVDFQVYHDGQAVNPQQFARSSS